MTSDENDLISITKTFAEINQPLPLSPQKINIVMVTMYDLGPDLGEYLGYTDSIFEKPLFYSLYFTDQFRGKQKKKSNKKVDKIF